MSPEVYRSFDEYAVALGHKDLRLTILGRQQKPWATCSMTLDTGVRVRWARDGGPCMFEAAIDADGVGLVICIDAAGRVSGNGKLFGPQSVMAIPGRTQIESVSFDSVDWMSVFIPATLLRYDITVEPLRTPCGLIDAASGDESRFNNTLTRGVIAAMDGAFDDNPAGQHDASRQLVAAARDILGADESTHADEPPHAGRHRISRDEILRRVQEHFDRHADAPAIGVEDLAASAGVSSRTLVTAFHERFGISPKRFLRVRTLNIARRALTHADPAQTRVTDVASQLGIWEWGRFSRDYRTLFGELPSQTLHRPERGRRS